MPLDRPRAILFDFGDTLVRVEGWRRKAGAQRLYSLAKNPRNAPFEKVYATAKQVDDIMRSGREQSSIEFSCRALHRLVYERFGMSFDLSARRMQLEFWRQAAVMKPFEGIAEALEDLKRRQIRMGVVSNMVFTGEILEYELDRHGLRKYFEFVMSSADYGFCKPNPLLMLTAAGKLDIDPREIWYIGDSRAYDVAGARAAGMRAIWFNSKSKPNIGPKPDATLTDWTQLAQRLDSINAAVA